MGTAFGNPLRKRDAGIDRIARNAPDILMRTGKHAGGLEGVTIISACDGSDAAAIVAAAPASSCAHPSADWRHDSTPSCCLPLSALAQPRSLPAD